MACVNDVPLKHNFKVYQIKTLANSKFASLSYGQQLKLLSKVSKVCITQLVKYL